MAENEKPKPGDVLYRCEKVYGTWRMMKGVVIELPEPGRTLAVLHWDGHWTASHDLSGWHATPEEAVTPHRENATAKWAEEIQKLNQLVPAADTKPVGKE